MLTRGRASKIDFYKVFGLLLDLAIYLRSDKPFYQRLQSQCTAAPRFCKMHVYDRTKDDLQWFYQILLHGNLTELPSSMFGAPPRHLFDNTTAVNRCNKLHSKNPFSQEINRSIGLVENFFNLSSYAWVVELVGRCSVKGVRPNYI
ncbi:LOW QUALITY PROTEIN: hypothetical protein PHMEG_0009595 [Phytophthora megakarya]|uniref:Uncharacterized protein n=1 Tax=Phytophthora megakarya TaxID=4795 RepID=A0A225WHV6_9STRA|nr:LOW QUALITY PROTEIN: hypothetical protein PHMEG_0009595 [Phytophthora megakarya]